MTKIKEEVTVGAPRLKPKKKRVWTKVILALIIGALLGGGSVYYYDNYYTKNKKDKTTNKVVEKNNKEEIKEINLSLDSYDVVRLMNGLHFTDGSIIEKTLYIENKTSAKDLDSNYLDNLLLKEAYRTKNSFTDTVTITDLEQARINIFGKNYEIVIPTDKEVGTCPIFNYDISKRTYTKSNNDCSLTSDIQIKYNTVKATMKEKEYLTIYEVAAFMNDDGVYKKIDGSNNLSEKIENLSKDDFDITENEKDLNQYKYNFKYDSDTSNYIFESIELVK